MVAMVTLQLAKFNQSPYYFGILFKKSPLKEESFLPPSLHAHHLRVLNGLITVLVTVT